MSQSGSSTSRNSIIVNDLYIASMSIDAVSAVDLGEFLEFIRSQVLRPAEETATEVKHVQTALRVSMHF